MAQVNLTNLNKIYPTRDQAVHAVKDLDLTVEDGEFVALLGPSGCGKTSTLRMIVGLETITSGTIAFDGKPVNDLTPEQRNVAMAFETYALYPNFTVAENLAFPLEVRGRDKAERDREVGRIARLLRIESILDQKPAQLSGGQQQRVSLGRALIRDPAVFILDEVMSHLDAHLKFQMLFELRRIHRSLGKTTIYVTHDQVEALALANRIAVMSNAVLQQYGTRDDLYHRPKNRFVADFIGEPPTNFFTAEIAEDIDGLVLQVDGSGLAFHPDGTRIAALRQRTKGQVTVGIRPQNFSLAAAPGKRSVTARVALNEYLGEQSIVTLEAGGTSFRALAAPDLRLSTGAPISLYYRSSDVMVFDPESERFIG
jgi:multiple sugar transport system ATP-binding protein